MLEIRKKHLNASMFHLPDQPMLVSFAENPALDAGTAGVILSPLLGEEYSGGMGTALNAGEGCVGIVIDAPALELDRGLIEKLVENNILLRDAYNMAAFQLYHDLAQAVAEHLFQQPVDPTLQIQFGEAQGDGHRDVQKVEVLMQGSPTGHPFWSLERV